VPIYPLGGKTGAGLIISQAISNRHVRAVELMLIARGAFLDLITESWKNRLRGKHG
jgi:hypothetical protein